MDIPRESDEPKCESLELQSTKTKYCVFCRWDSLLTSYGNLMRYCYFVDWLESFGNGNDWSVQMNDGLNAEVEIPSSINLVRSDTKVFKSIIAESIILQDADLVQRNRI